MTAVRFRVPMVNETSTPLREPLKSVTEPGLSAG
jgi:hypothetical protein